MIKEITLEPGRCYSMKLHSPFKTKKGYEEFMSIIIALLKNNINVAFVNSFYLNKEISKNHLNYSDICEHIKRYLNFHKMTVPGQLYMIDLEYQGIDYNNFELCEIEGIINDQEYFTLTRYDVVIFEGMFLLFGINTDEKIDLVSTHKEEYENFLEESSKEVQSWAKCLGLTILSFYD